MTAREHDPVALTVVRGLVMCAVLGLTITGILCYIALQYEGDSSTIAIIAIVGNLAAGALGGLGAVLATTGKASTEPTPVTTAPGDVLQVESQQATAGTNPEVTIHDDTPASSDL